MSPTNDDIWMVEVGLNGWSMLCQSYHEAYAVARERVNYLSMMQKKPIKEYVLICLNGVKYEELVLSSKKQTLTV